MQNLIGVKVFPEVYEQFASAAAQAGKTIPTWLRDLGVAAVTGQIKTHDVEIAGSGGMKVRIMDPPVAPAFPEHELSVVAEEPEVYVSERVAAAEKLVDLMSVVKGMMPGKDLPAPASSLAFVRGLLQMEEGEANETLLSRTRGEVPPKSCGGWYRVPKLQQALAKWLDANYPEIDEEGF